MDELRPDEIAARVLAWQHRGPLARRIRASQVQSVGVVALPFASAQGEGAGDDAAAAPAFSEDFIAPLAPARIARFAARHAVAALPLNPATPLREVLADPLPAGQGVRHRYLLTAAIEVDGQRTRVLLGPTPGAPVVGRRLPDRRRQGLAGAAVAALVAAVLAWPGDPGAGRTPEPGPTAAAVQPAPSPAPAAVQAAEARGSLPPEAAASTAPATDVAIADAVAAVTTAAAAAEPEPPAHERPPDVEPRWGTVSLPPRPQVVKPLPKRRQAAAPAAVATASASASASAAAAAAAAASVPSAPPRAMAAPPPGQVWAVSTRLVRTRAESEQLAHAMRALVGGSGEVKVEAVAVGDDWRVAAWPYLRRRDAERAQAVLAARGMRAEVVAF